jgi:hypothetical protein
VYLLVPDQEREPDQKKIPGIPPQGNDSSRVAESHDVPAQGRPASDGFVPAPIQVPGHYGKWRYEITRQILPLDLLAPTAPEAEEGGFIFAYDDSGVRTTDETPAPMKLGSFQNAGFHIAPPGLYLSEKLLFTHMGEINPYGLKCQSNL